MVSNVRILLEQFRYLVFVCASVPACIIGLVLEGFGQADTLLDLKETSVSAGRASFTSKPILHHLSPTLRDSTGEAGSRIFKLKPSNFLWGGQIADEKYLPTYLVLMWEERRETLRIGFGTYQLSKTHSTQYYLDSHVPLTIRFVPESEYRSEDTISISVQAKLNDKGEIVLSPFLIHTGSVLLGDTLLDFHVWPYQNGPMIKFGEDPAFSLVGNNPYYRLGEIFSFSGERYSFVDYDYVHKKIILRTASLDGHLYGYKVGRFFEGWQENERSWDSLGIDRGKPLLLYFGGEWCPPCLQELPRLQRIAELLTKYGISVASVAVMDRGGTVQALQYLTQNNFPGFHLTEGLGKPASLHKRLKVYSYPTYIFIGQEGEILFRAENRGERDNNLYQFLSQYLMSLKK